MAKRFYNPGTAIENRIPFDNPTKGENGEVFPSYYPFSAPEHTFFEVSSEMEVPAPGGDTITVALDIYKRVAADYARYGIVLIDPKLKELKDGGNLVRTDAEGKALGDEIWKEHMYGLVREHQQKCLEARQAGMVPRRAIGPVAYALRTLGIEDPAGDVADVVQKKEDMGEVAELKKLVASLQKSMLDLATAKGK